VTTELYLVRHGETDWNRQRRIQGLTDIALNDTGREQARETARRLGSRPWDGVYTSPLGRARETAEIIASELGLPEPTALGALVERNYGEAEGLDFAEVDRRWPERGSVPGQETREEVMERVLPALRELADAHPGESLVVVSHGGAIRAVLMAVQPDASHGMISNGSVHSFRFGDQLELIAFDDPLTDSLDEQNAVEAREDGVA
jgi:broad specificity phosphatase PhoE